MNPLLIAGIVIVLMGVYVVFAYNRLVSLRARADNSWSDIDVQLRKRWDLVPRLVETVRGYAAHESETLEEVTRARGDATKADGPTRRAAPESHLGHGVVRLLAIAERYPDLGADKLFVSLHEELIQIEESLQSARRYYNAVVRDLNTKIQQFPSVLVARTVGFGEYDYFELDDPREAIAPSVAESLR